MKSGYNSKSRFRDVRTTQTSFVYRARDEIYDNLAKGNWKSVYDKCYKTDGTPNVPYLEIAADIVFNGLKLMQGKLTNKTTLTLALEIAFTEEFKATKDIDAVNVDKLCEFVFEPTFMQNDLGPSFLSPVLDNPEAAIALCPGECKRFALSSLENTSGRNASKIFRAVSFIRIIFKNA